MPAQSWNSDRSTVVSPPPTACAGPAGFVFSDALEIAEVFRHAMREERGVRAFASRFWSS